MADGFLSSDTRDTTWIKPLGTGWKKVTYAAVDGLAVFEGCIILGTVAEAQAVKKFVDDNPGIRQEGVEAFGTGIVGTQFRWKNNTIPFQIDPNLPNPQRVLDAIKHWEDNTPIRLVERNAADPAHRDFVVFRPGQRLRVLDWPARRSAGRDPGLSLQHRELHSRDRPHRRALARAEQERPRSIRDHQARRDLAERPP